MQLSNDDNVFGTDNVEPQEGQFDNSSEENTVNEENNDNSAPEGQAENEDQVINEGEQQAEQQPLIMGKFKTQDDLISAYNNLEKRFTQLSQQAKSAPKQEQQTNQAEQDKSQEEQLMAWYNETVKTDPVRANATLAQYIAQKEFNNYKSQFESQLQPLLKDKQETELINRAATKYSDFHNYDGKIVEEMLKIGEEEPDLIDSPLVYEIAYKRAKIKELETKANSAFENGKKAASQNKEAKKKILNENNNAKSNDDTDIPGLTILPESDGVFF